MKEAKIKLVTHELKPDCKYLVILDPRFVSSDDAVDLYNSFEEQGINAVLMFSEPDGIRVEVVPKKKKS